MNEELVSIIIPAYNAEKTIKIAIDSALQQIYKNIEVIVINDGSTDKTNLIVNNIIEHDKRVKLVETENFGVSHARNIGIKSSKGKYVTFLDSDDFIDKEMISEMYKCIKEYNVKIVKCNCKMIENNTQRILEDYNIKGLIRSKELLKHLIMYEENIKGYSCVYMFEKNNIIFFNEDLSYMEDNDFLLKVLLKNENIYILDKPLYNYVLNDNSVTRSQKKLKEQCFKILDSINSMENTLIKNNIDKNLMDEFYNLYYQYVISKISKIKSNKDKLTIINNKIFINLINNLQYSLLKKKQKVGYILLKLKLYKLFFIVLKINNIRRKK